MVSERQIAGDVSAPALNTRANDVRTVPRAVFFEGHDGLEADSSISTALSFDVRSGKEPLVPHPLSLLEAAPTCDAEIGVLLELSE
jgi:hypothetical protein